MVYCAALGGAIGVCLAFVAENLAEQYEHLLIGEEMEAELDTQIGLHQNPADDDSLARTPWRSVYIDRPGHPPTSPLALRHLAPGVHEISNETEARFAGIRQAPIGRITMVAGLPDSPQRERRFAEELVAMVVLGVVVGGWLGRLLAGRMLAPVLRLSSEVDRADPGAQLRGIAHDHSGDEVGALAVAFLRYQDRVKAAIEREVLFSADAGHELRTPLATLQGALELLDAQIVQAPARRKIDRIRRCASEINLLLDALTLLARPEESPDAQPCRIDLCAALASAIEEFREELAAADVEITLRCQPDAVVQAPSNLPRTALRLLLRSVAGGTWGQRLQLEVGAQAVCLRTVESTAAVSATEAATSLRSGDALVRRSDESGGVGMLRRLCERYGWSFRFGTSAHDGFLVGWDMLDGGDRGLGAQSDVNASMAAPTANGSSA